MLVLAACSPSPPNAGEILREALPESVAPGQHVTVKLAEAFSASAWDTFAIMCPYEAPVDVAADLGIPTAGIPDLARTDQYQAILLLDDAALVHASQFPRGAIDLCSIHSEERVTLGANDDLVLTRDVKGTWTLASPVGMRS